MDSTQLLIALLLPVLGAIFALNGLRLMLKHRRAMVGALETSGVIIGVRERPTVDGGVDHPVVRFTASDGQMIEFEGQTSVIGGAKLVGKPVQVIYPPNRPELAQIKSFGQQYLYTTLMIGAGLLFIVVPLLGAAYLVLSGQ
jgi:hypothetical protein